MSLGFIRLMMHGHTNLKLARVTLLYYILIKKLSLR